MIEPQVLQGGASSWFCIAANADLRGAGAGPPTTGSAATALAVAVEPSAGAAASAASSRLLTPARNCASGDRNFEASQRKM